MSTARANAEVPSARRSAQGLGTVLPDAVVPTLFLPTFTYRATDASGLVEHGLWPVHLARQPHGAVLDPAEVVETRWWLLAEVRRAVAAAGPVTG